jgi:hypothetical protein
MNSRFKRTQAQHSGKSAKGEPKSCPFFEQGTRLSSSTMPRGDEIGVERRN